MASFGTSKSRLLSIKGAIMLFLNLKLVLEKESGKKLMDF